MAQKCETTNIVKNIWQRQGVVFTPSDFTLGNK